MTTLRALLARHRRLAIVLAVLALCMKALVPTGYMPAGGMTLLSVTICAESTGEQLVRTIAIPAKQDGAPGHDAGEKPCAFAALGAPMLAGAPPALLAIALAFVLALTFRPTRAPRVARPAGLHPPLRGPPLPA